jgi:hypothetical protein
MRKLSKIIAGAVLCCATASVAAAGEKSLMHCFYFTTIKEATDADWQAFYKATDALPSEIKGLKRVWYGKLTRPFWAYNVDAETRKKFTGGADKVEHTTVTGRSREFGVCMEFEDMNALKAYGAKENAAHNNWVKIYEKVRVAGTTTFDFMGQ